MGQPVVHFEVTGKDARALQSFYSSMFGWKIASDNPLNYGMVAREGNVADGGAGIGGGIGQAMDEQGGRVTFYVGVDDVETALAMAQNLGGSRLMGPMTVPGGPEIGLLTDPEGHVVGVMKTPT